MVSTIETLDTRPFKHLIMTIGELPSSFVDSMSYYEMLAWLCNYLETQVVPVVNNNSLVTQELQDYVEHYFDNLDVQEEIDNKLDDMAESGELADIIAAYIQLRGVLAYDTVAAMKAADNLVNGSFAETYGFYAKGDGGSAKYKIREVTNADTIDEVFLFALTGSETLVAELIVDDSMNVKQFGVKADGETDCSSIIAKIESKGYNTIYFPDGTYVLNTKQTFTNIKTIRGQSRWTTTIKAPNGFCIFGNSSVFENITFNGVSINSNTCLEGVFAYSTIKNVTIKNYAYAMKTKNGTWISEITGLYILDCTNGVQHEDGTFNNISIRDGMFQRISGIAFETAGDKILFDGCDFEACGTCFNRGGRGMVVSNCYIEGNDNIVNINTASYNSDITIDKCWLASKGANATNGWLGKFNTVSNPDTQTASLFIKNSQIRNLVKDTLKPFAFNGSDTRSYWAVSLKDNEYFDITTEHQYIVYYCDLFDLSVATLYLKTQNMLTFVCDIPLYIYSGITAFRETLGNKRGNGRSNIVNRFLGHYAIEKTSGQITITPDYKVANFYPQQNNVPVMVRFTDGSIDLVGASIDGASIYVNPTYNSRTTAEVIFDCSYMGQ